MDTTLEEKLLEHVRTNATQNDPDSVVAEIDQFCWSDKDNWMMHLGNAKGEIVDTAVKKCIETAGETFKFGLELGSYCGYSAVRIARHFPVGSRLFSLDLSPERSAIAQKMAQFAGLGDKVTFIVANIAEESTRSKLREDFSKSGASVLDFVFIDHHKKAYKSDLQTLEKSDMLNDGCMVIADNVIYPGAPDFLEYVRNSPNYKCEHFPAKVEYSDDQEDAVEICMYSA